MLKNNKCNNAKKINAMNRLNAMYSLLLMICVASPLWSQTFSNTTASACNTWDSGNSWATALTKNITVSGLPTSGLGANTILRQVNIQLGNASCKGDMRSYWVRLQAPNGTLDTLIAAVTTTISSVWLNVRLRDHKDLERIKDHSNGNQGSYHPYSIGYYKSNVSNSFSRFNNGSNPNGTWQIQIIENTSSEVSFEKVDLIFGSPIVVNDVTASKANDSCGGATCMKTNEIIVGANKGYSATDPRYPGSPVNGCDWNSANNNSAWFQFIPGATSATITVSGFLIPGGSTSQKIQAVVLQAPASCTTTPTIVPSGGCPKAAVNNTAYLSSNGGGTSTAGNIYVNGITTNMEFILSGLTACQRYYLYIDGEGGDSSVFYIEYTAGAAGGSVTSTVQRPSCNQNNGKIKLNYPCAGATYSWSANAGVTGNKDSATNLAAGTYSVTVSNGTCPVFDTTIILTQDSLKWTHTKLDPKCGQTNGSISINVTSPGAVTYTWSANAGVGNVSSASNLGNGTYKVTISQNGCIDSLTVSLLADSLKWTRSITQPTCGVNNGVITANVTSTGTVTYTWSANAGVGNVNSATGLGAGTYKVTVSQWGCTDSATVVFVGTSNVNRDTIYPVSCLSYSNKSQTFVRDTAIVDTIRSVINTACDSIIRRLVIDIRDTSGHLFTQCIQHTDSFLFNGSYRKTPGTYRDTLTNIAGCDSFLRLNLLVITLATNTSDSNSCDSVLWKGIYYKSNTSLNDTLKSQHGCDSVITTMQIRIHTATTATSNITQCDSVVFKGNTYKVNATVLDTIKKVLSPYCDSVYRTINIQILPKDTTRISGCLVSGQVYNLYGNNLTTAGTHYHRLTQANGCDSIIELNLRVITTSTQTRDTFGCKSLLYKSVNYTTNTTISDTIRTSQNCDSIYQTLRIYILNTTANTASRNGCDTVIYKSKLYFASTTIIDTTKKTVSPFCDSIYTTVTITVNRRDTTRIVACTHQGQFYNFYGNFLSSQGIYFHSLTRANGCDSVIRLSLSVVIAQTQSTRDTAACDSFVHKNRVYKINSIIPDTIKGYLGCDSIYRNLRLTLFRPNTGNPDTMRGCEEVIFRGQRITTNSVFDSIIRKRVFPFCDSLVKKVRIIIYPLPNPSITARPDTVVKLGETVALSASGGVSYLWLINSSTTNPLSYTMQDRTYFEVRVRDRNGCEKTTGIWIGIEPEIEISEAFSPNGDGINDVIGPIIKGPVQIVSYKIFNRWGQVIYQGEGVNAKWDGKFKGEDQPQGSYVYTLEYKMNGQIKTKVGGITLIK
jgi:gliding motility-associated-like protein